MDRVRLLRLVWLLLRIVGGVTALYVALWLYKRLLFPLLVKATGLSPTTAAIVGPLGSLLAAALAYAAYVRWTERRWARELAFRPQAIAIGAAAGSGLIGVTIVALFCFGCYVVDDTRPFAAAVPVVCTIVTAAVLEEIFFRGVLFRNLENAVGTAWAVGGVAVLFGLLHVFNPGTTPFTVVSSTLLGAIWCAIFIVSRNLWVVGLNHTAWNLTIFLSGLPLSGQAAWREVSPLASHAEGPFWLTGDTFGPEDSVINIALSGLALALLWRWSSRHGLLVRSSTDGAVAANAGKSTGASRAS